MNDESRLANENEIHPHRQRLGEVGRSCHDVEKSQTVDSRGPNFTRNHKRVTTQCVEINLTSQQKINGGPQLGRNSLLAKSLVISHALTVQAKPMVFNRCATRSALWEMYKQEFSTNHGAIFINLLRWERVFDYQLKVLYCDVIHLGL